MLSDSPFHLRPAEATPSALEGYSRLLSQVFGAGPRFTGAALAWRYGANPLGQVVGTDAFVGDDLAAHYATCPAPISVGGRGVKALLSLNTATHPDHQGRGLFTSGRRRPLRPQVWPGMIWSSALPSPTARQVSLNA